MVDLAVLRPMLQNYTPELLNQQTGLSEIIIRRIRDGKETNPRESTIGLLYRAMKDTQPDIQND
tara:strand:- start:8388 stop:8579 length:192 start_codon:yes stop_codon:yes gene_type:complete